MIENNKLIAKFMGLTIITDGISWFDTNFNTLKKYHEDWNALMDVIEKIYSTSGEGKSYYGVTFVMQNDIFRFSLDNIERDFLTTHSPKRNGDSRIEYVHKAVVEFIKWYNNENRNRNKENTL